MWKKPETENEPPAERPVSPPSAERVQTPSAKERALIGPSIKIEGSLSGGEDLLIEGRVEGKIELAQHGVTIGMSGLIKANIHGRSITVLGQVEGDLFGSEQIILRQSSKVRGNLVAPRVSLEDGADFKGSIDMTAGSGAEQKPPHAESPAAKSLSQPVPGQDAAGKKA